MTTGTSTQFSKWYSCSKSGVTHFKDNDQLVYADNGLIEFELSAKRIKETSDPNRDDVRIRHAKNRATKKSVSVPADKESPQIDSELEETEPSFQDSRAMKEKYLALQAKTDYEKSRGLLVERAEVERDFIRIATIMRSAFERMPDFLAAEFATEDDQNRIRAMLTEEIEAALRQGADQISKLK